MIPDGPGQISSTTYKFADEIDIKEEPLDLVEETEQLKGDQQVITSHNHAFFFH